MKKALPRACRFFGLLLILTLCACRPDAPPSPETAESEAIPPAIQNARDVAFDHPPDGQDAPAVIEIAAINPGEEDKPASALPTERLAWRFARAGIRLKPHLLDAFFADMESYDALADACNLTWMQYRQFGVLILQRPGAEESCTCFVFEDDYYKGYIGIWGRIDQEDCFVSMADELWLKATRTAHGTGFGCADQYWYRLTSLGLDRELLFTENLAKNPNAFFEVAYREEVTAVARGEYGFYVSTSWHEEICGSGEEPVFRFQREGENRYSLSPISQYEPYELQTRGTYLYYLNAYRAEFENLIENGTPEQREALYHFIDFLARDELRAAQTDLSALYRWYEQTGGAE